MLIIINLTQLSKPSGAYWSHTLYYLLSFDRFTSYMTIMHLTPFLLLIASTGTLAKHPSYPRLAPKVQRIARQLPESGLFARQDCPGQSCGTGCIDLGDSCCDVMVGNYCTAGETCNYDGTCCPVGETCGFDDTISDDISIDDDITVDNCGIDESMCGSGMSRPYAHFPDRCPDLNYIMLTFD